MFAGIAHPQNIYFHISPPQRNVFNIFIECFLFNEYYQYQT